METPLETVTRFCAAWPALDIEALAAFFAVDATYHNIPVEPVVGRDQIAATIAGFTNGVARVEFEIVHAVADGRVVLTERIDRFIWNGGHTATLPVSGTFEIDDDGLIAAWRDYFDMQQFLVQMPA